MTNLNIYSKEQIDTMLQNLSADYQLLATTVNWSNYFEIIKSDSTHGLIKAKKNFYIYFKVTVTACKGPMKIEKNQPILMVYNETTAKLFFKFDYDTPSLNYSGLKFTFDIANETISAVEVIYKSGENTEQSLTQITSLTSDSGGYVIFSS